jgi:hypothetical protein
MFDVVKMGDILQVKYLELTQKLERKKFQETNASTNKRRRKKYYSKIGIIYFK